MKLMNVCELSRRDALGARASCCASFGELLQGSLPDADDFLVTLPIDLHAHAQFDVSTRRHDLRVLPAGSWKTSRLVESLLRQYHLPLRGELQLTSAIPRGKGLASSTADLVAAYRAVTNYYRLPQRTDVLESLLREIEPSDGVMHAGTVAYLHRQARLHERLGAVPPLTLVAIDEGGEVQTLAHNCRDRKYPSSEREEYAALLTRLRHALERGDIKALGAVSTRSAQLNQRVLPKRRFDVMVDIAAAVHAAGVVVAHSGTYVAILIDGRDADHDLQVRRSISRIMMLGEQPQVFTTRSREATGEDGSNCTTSAIGVADTYP